MGENMKKKIRSGLVPSAALAIALTAAFAGCGGSSTTKPTERELLQQTRSTLSDGLRFISHDAYTEGEFAVSTGTCTISVIATGADAPAYAGYPWSVESPDGEVVIKVGNNEGAFQEDCNAAIEAAMGW
jgi:hypothetical protein